MSTVSSISISVGPPYQGMLPPGASTFSPVGAQTGTALMPSKPTASANAWNSATMAENAPSSRSGESIPSTARIVPLAPISRAT